MQTTVRNLMVGVLLSSGAFAQTEVAPAQEQSASETTEVIAAQTTITEGHINSILQKIGNQSGSQQFKATDYWAQVGEFKDKVDKTMKEFEEKLEKDIFPKVAIWVKEYNSIHASKEFSKEQKAMILNQRYQTMENHLNKLSGDYQKAIAEVYKLVPLSDTQMYQVKKFNTPLEVHKIARRKAWVIDTTMQIEFGGYKTKTYPVKIEHGKRRNEVTIRIEDNSWLVNTDQWGVDLTKGPFKVRKKLEVNLDKFLNNAHQNFDDYNKFVNAEVFKEIVFPIYKGTCQSMICLSLRAADYSTLLISINSLIDREIPFELADGKEVSLQTPRRSVNSLLEAFARVDYPVELPFDI